MSEGRNCAHSPAGVHTASASGKSICAPIGASRPLHEFRQILDLALQFRNLRVQPVIFQSAKEFCTRELREASAPPPVEAECSAAYSSSVSRKMRVRFRGLITAMSSSPL